MVNKDVSQFIKSCAHYQFVSLCTREAQQMIHTIDSDTPFGLLFLDFWESGDIPDRDGCCKILTCLYCMTEFGLISASGLKEIKSNQVSRWNFVNFFVPFGIPKIVLVDADGISSGMFSIFPGVINHPGIRICKDQLQGNYK